MKTAAAAALFLLGSLPSAHGGQAPTVNEWNIIIEAETAYPIPPAHLILSRDGASGGQCIVISDLAADDDMWHDQNTDRGELLFSPDLPLGGEHYLWARIQWHCTCGRHIAVDCTGVPVASGEAPSLYDNAPNAEAGTLITSSVRPGVWHWVSMGAYAFEAGVQAVRLKQSGHRVLIDSIALSTDAGYRPPGYVDETQRFTAYERHPEIIDAKDGRVVFRLGDREWSDFRLDMALNVPEGSEGSGAVSVGLGFCVQPDGRRYELIFTRNGGGVLAAELRRVKADSAVVLDTSNSMVEGAGPHSLGLARVGEDIYVEFDGTTLIHARDGSLASGAVNFMATNVDQAEIEEVEIRPLGNFEEYFAAGAVHWRELSGIWKTVMPDEANVVGKVYLAKSEGQGLSVSPWSLPSRYTFETRLQLLGPGRAGIAFDIVDEGTFGALVFESGQQSGSRSPRLSILQSRRGVMEELWSSAVEGEPDQWHQLRLERSPGAVTFSIDSNEAISIETTAWHEGNGAGLFAGKSSSVMFTSVRAREDFRGSRELYLFEPEGDSRALSHWRQTQGKFLLGTHPAVLFIEPEPGLSGGILELKRAIKGSPSIEVSVAPSRQLRSTRSTDSNLLELVVPILPGDPLVGVALVLGREERTEYEVLVDERDMRSIAVRRDGVQLAAKTFSGPRSAIERTLYVRVEGDSIVAGVVGAAELRIHDEGLVHNDSNGLLKIVTKNMSPDDVFAISRIVVREMPPRLAAARSERGSAEGGPQ